MNNVISKTVTTKINFTVKSVWSNFSTVDKWNTSKLGGLKNGRKTCKGCNRKWTDINTGGVHLCICTDAPNKIICDDCLSKLDESLISRDDKT